MAGQASLVMSNPTDDFVNDFNWSGPLSLPLMFGSNLYNIYVKKLESLFPPPQKIKKKKTPVLMSLVMSFNYSSFLYILMETNLNVAFKF